MSNASVVEIELSAAARRLVRGFPFTAGIAIVFGLIGWGISQLLPPYFEATANVVVANPDLIFRFDPRIETQVDPPPGEGLAEIALSDALVAELLQAGIELGLPTSTGIEDLQRDLRVTARGNTLSMKVTCPFADACPLLANRWADTFSNTLNVIYAGAGRDAEEFANRAIVALENWKSAQDQLIAFQATNEEAALARLLAAQSARLEALLQERARLDDLLVDARDIQARAALGPVENRVNRLDRILIQLIALRSLSSRSVASNWSQPVLGDAAQFQSVISPDFALQVAADQGTEVIDFDDATTEYLDQLIASMVSRRASLGDLEQETRSRMLDLQGAHTGAMQERVRLEEATQLSRETYQTLERKAVESQLASDGERVARVATRAVVPDEAAGPSAAAFTVAGVALGLAVGAFGVVARPNRMGREGTPQGSE